MRARRKPAVPDFKAMMLRLEQRAMCFHLATKAKQEDVQVEKFTFQLTSPIIAPGELARFW